MSKVWRWVIAEAARITWAAGPRHSLALSLQASGVPPKAAVHGMPMPHASPALASLGLFAGGGPTLRTDLRSSCMACVAVCYCMCETSHGGEAVVQQALGIALPAALVEHACRCAARLRPPRAARSGPHGASLTARAAQKGHRLGCCHRPAAHAAGGLLLRCPRRQARISTVCDPETAPGPPQEARPRMRRRLTAAGCQGLPAVPLMARPAHWLQRP